MPYGLDPLYVAGEDLNQYLVDKSTGAPLAGGSVYFYKDTDRNDLKSVYQLTQLTSNPPNYSYTALTNPVILSGVGTIVDANGNQVALYYYPYDGSGNMELYYIEVYDANGLLQFTREAWPYPNLGTGGGGASGTINNASANSVAYYATTGTTISGITPAANSVLATSGGSVPSMTQMLPSAVQVSTGSLNGGINASSSTFWRGDGTWMAPSVTNPISVWLSYNRQTSVINDSFNVVSVTDNSTGVFTINFTNALANANYAATITSGMGSGGGYTASIIADGGTGLTTTTAQFDVAQVTGVVAPSNSAVNSVVCVGG